MKISRFLCKWIVPRMLFGFLYSVFCPILVRERFLYLMKKAGVDIEGTEKVPS